jgi:ubiquinone/menaquinone biosynthesis C-methylase UbiE
VADDYEAAFADDLERLPLDRAMLRYACDHLPRPAAALDLGCGPASVAGRLLAAGATTVGVDLSAGMLQAARRRHPALAVARSDMRGLPLRDSCMDVVVAYYSIQHVPRSQLTAVLAEIGRVLRPDGLLLVATHLGEGDVVVDELLGHRVGAIGGALYQRSELLERLQASGFHVEVEQQRGPLRHEVDTQRIYLVSRRHA